MLYFTAIQTIVTNLSKLTHRREWERAGDRSLEQWSKEIKARNPSTKLWWFVNHFLSFCFAAFWAVFLDPGTVFFEEIWLDLGFILVWSAFLWFGFCFCCLWVEIRSNWDLSCWSRWFEGISGFFFVGFCFTDRVCGF